MSKTIRVSDDLYGVINDYRGKDETFQDVIEEMAHEIGLLPSMLKDLDHLRRKLKNLYEYEQAEVERVLEALQLVYVGQERESTIGIPHEDVESDYGDELRALKRLGLIKEHHYTGKYDYGYRTTSVGERIGSELIRDRIDAHEDELQDVLQKYGDYEVALFVQTGFERSELGHLSTRSAPLAVEYQDALFEDEALEGRFRSFLEDMIDSGFAVRHSEGQFVVIPPEVDDYLHDQPEWLATALETVEIYEALRTYHEEDIDTIGGLLDELHVASESELEALIDSFHDDGLTSPYPPREDQPILIKDADGLLDRIREDLRAEVELEDQNARGEL